MMTWQEFYKKYKGKAVDLDHAWGPQCWDLWAQYEACQGVPRTNCTATGWAQDIWTQRKKSGVLNYFDEVKPENIREGDWVIWPSTYRLTPYSHIGMNVGKNQCFGQNQGGQKAANVITLDMKKAYGGLRFKGYPNKLKVDGKFDKTSVLALQTWLGAWRDGYIGNQREKYKKNHPNLVAVQYTNSGTSNTVKALQAKLNSSGFKMGIDGQWGPKTSGNLQKFLTKKGFPVGTDNIFGPKTAKRLQEFLNKEVL